MLSDWETVQTNIRLLINGQSDVGSHCLLRRICPNISTFFGYIRHILRKISWVRYVKISKLRQYNLFRIKYEILFVSTFSVFTYDAISDMRQQAAALTPD